MLEANGANGSTHGIAGSKQMTHGQLWIQQQHKELWSEFKPQNSELAKLLNVLW